MALATKTKKKPTVQHKKRQAKHHRHSKHYLKAYWPYMPVLLIIAGGLLVNSYWQKSHVLGANSNLSASALLESTNQSRSSAGETGLTLDPQLASAAQAKATDMAARNYWSHTSPDGKTPWAFISSNGYQYQQVGENLAYGFGSAGDIIAGWNSSPSHRANLLNKNYSNVGFGVANSPNYQGNGPQTIVVAEYGQPLSTTNQPSLNASPLTQTTSSAAIKSVNTELAASSVTRAQVLAGGHQNWVVAIVSALAGVSLTLYLLHYGYRLQRVLSRGEAFVAHHPYVDMAALILLIAGYILTRTSGLIR